MPPDTVTFYEKPGCAGNARQKEILRQAGLRLEVRNLLAEPWTPERLRPFFGERPVGDWLTSPPRASNPARSIPSLSPSPRPWRC
jgi:arsenate reductase-like glutaredoxin family protein